MPIPTRDDLANRYLEQLPYAPYPVQEEALLAWFASDQGVLVCAPTGTGKTLIAEAALFEALHTGKTAYYTTPLIALTEQKFQEMQDAAVRWGFSPDDVGLVTGNRHVNPQARVLVVVAEILVNRLLHASAFDFSAVSGVVMDEFHNFADFERGIVWELALALLPKHVRLLLLSATVGNAQQFVNWLEQSHGRKIELVQGTVRKVPLSYRWVGDQFLTEQLELMVEGDLETRRTPALVFCFNREECWNVAEQLKGKSMLSSGQQAQLADELKQHEWNQGAGPKLKQILFRGVGVHHAGVLPKYRRVVEDLFQRKLLSVCVCTETLAAGINLPARSVVLPTLLKGPPGKKLVIDPSAAHQIFGRAGRPQFDREGFVYALAHEDDVKILRWREKFDQIPEQTKDPGLLRAKKDLKRKMPTRRTTEQYWNENQFTALCQAPPGKLFSKGPLPWRLLAYLLQISPDLSLLRTFVGKRLMESGRLASAQRRLDQMLLTLHHAGYVVLDPPPPAPKAVEETATAVSEPIAAAQPVIAETAVPIPLADALPTLFAGAASSALPSYQPNPSSAPNQKPLPKKKPSKMELLLQQTLAPEYTARHDAPPPAYQANRASPTPELAKLLLIRGVNPLYALFLMKHLGLANPDERLQVLESLLEMPSSLGASVWVPGHDDLPPGPLALTRLDPLLLQLGLVVAEQLVPPTEEEKEEDRHRGAFTDRRPRLISLADKLRLLFDYEYAGVDDFRTTPVWVAGELLRFGGDFNQYVTSKQLVKQEGVIFRHLLRLTLLCGEFAQLTPDNYDATLWQAELRDLANRLSATCHTVDPTSTDKALEEAKAPDALIVTA